MLFPERPITAEHVRAFCAKFNEGYRVEYKRNFDANVREKAPKVLASFANSHGGVLVIGVNAPGGVPQPPFEGFEPAPRDEYPLTVENICLQNVYPPLLPRTTVVKSDIGERIFLVIEIDESSQTPHAIENSTQVYVRTGNAANPYELADVDLIFDLAKRRKGLFELRARLLERAKTRFSAHVGARGLGPRLQFSVGPRFPTRQLCQYEELVPIMEANAIAWRGYKFPSYTSPFIIQHESAVKLDAAHEASILDASIWGQLFYGTHDLLASEVKEQGVYTLRFVGYVLLFIRHAAKMLDSLHYSGPVAIEIVLSWILGLRWLHRFEGYLDGEEGSRLDNEVTIEAATTTDEVLRNPDGVAAQLLRQVLFSVNCPALVDTQEKVDMLVRKGYSFNDWPR
jgi:hypothetical protein